MSELSPRELDLVLQARADERQCIIDTIQKFVRTTVLSDGDTISEIKVPANHLISIIDARGRAESYVVSGITTGPDPETK